MLEFLVKVFISLLILDRNIYVKTNWSSAGANMGLLQSKILSHNVIMCLVGLKPKSWLSRVCWLRDCLLPKSVSNFGTEAAFPKFFA